MNFKVKAVMIDLDGTLIHTAPEIARAANLMLTALALPVLSESQVEAYIGEGAITLINRCLAQQLDGVPDAALLANAQKLFFDSYAEIVAESKPYPHAVEALQLIQSAGYRLACVTNKPASFTLPLLEKTNLLQYFDLVVSGDTLQKKKPEPDQILYICDKFEIAVNEAVLVGDSKTDITAARSAGCYVFTVPYGYNQGQRIEPHAVDALINNMSEVLDLIDSTH
ncbi:MAG TPA: phosphoglycolate phosphatase [Methylotenera sp.]|nr:phosphoglycolate phosphatase [Methylotenera sp.]